MRTQVVTVAGITLAAAATAHAANETAPMMQYLGYTQLFQMTGPGYGANLATGSNVPVSIAETLSSGGGYYPNTADGRFAGKTLTPTSSFTAGNASHATNVGARFFGNDTGFSTRSVATGVQNVQMYSYSEFKSLYFIHPTGGSNNRTPYGSPNNSRVSSHAYGDNDATLESITKLDFTVQRDDYLHVVDARNFSTEGNSFNSIVSAPAGGSGTLTSAVGAGTPYVAGRTSVNITGPLPGAGSDSIGQVAGVITLLMSRGMTTSSNHTYTTAATTAVTAPFTGTFTTYVKPGYTVQSGSTSEVVKAALMAGAHRNIATYINGALTVPGITDYRNTPADQSPNGLDTRYGAGMVSAVNSYNVINAGEKNSFQDGIGGNPLPGGITTTGFDYDPSFGGADGSNATATYGFTATGAGKFFATLAWNLDVAGGASSGLLDSGGKPTTGLFSTAATLHDLDLTLIDLTAGGAVVASSLSTLDNTENLYTDLIAGHLYTLSVTTKGAAFDWDYGLAWRADVALTAAAVPEPASLAGIALAAFGLRRRRR